MDFSGITSAIATYAPQILIAVLVFGVLIFVHELGHFLAAKWSGIKVNEFAMGMGPVLFKRQKGETIYALRLFPIGGFCALEGDDQESTDSRAFGRAPLYKRMITMLAGSFMNLLLGLIILGVLSSQQSLLGTTVVNSFGENASSSRWLKEGDEILRINNHRVRSNNDIVYEMMRDRDGIMNIEVARQFESPDDNKTENILLEGVTFKMETVQDDIQAITIDFTVRGVKPTFLGIVLNSFNWTNSIIKQVWGGFIDIVTGRYGFNQLSGPVGVTSAIGQAATFGWKSLFMLMAFITVNLGVFNLLPLPALDGGRMVFLLIEAVRRKPINPRYEGIVHGVGFMLLIALMVAVTFNDVAKLL